MLRLNRARALTGIGVVTAGLLVFMPTAGATVPDVGVVHTLTAAGSDVTYNVQLGLDALYEDSPGCTLTSVPPPGATGQVGAGTKDNRCSTDQPSRNSTPPGPANPLTENYSHDVIAEYYPQGSTAGLYELCHQGSTGIPNLSFVRSTRAPASTDCTGLTGEEYATDGLAPVTFPGPVTDAINAYNEANPSTPFFFTKQALTQLFSTCVDSNGDPLVDWSQLSTELGPSFPDDPIQFWSVSASYGVENVWAKYLGVPSPYTGAESCALAQSPSHIIPPSNAAPIETSSDPGDAIYFYSIGLNGVTGGQTSILQPIGTTSAIQPTTADVQNQTWPVIHGLYNIYPTDTTNTNLTHYVGPSGWICSDHTHHVNDPLTGVNYALEIQQTITNNGFVALPDNDGSVCLTSNT